MATRSECRRCGRDIIWALTIPGHKRMPVDPGIAPDDEDYANLAVRKDHLGGLYVRVLTKGELPMVTERRGVPHFATCPARARQKPTPAPTPEPRTASPQQLPENVIVFPTRS